MSKFTAKQQYWSEKLLHADAFDGSLAEYAQTQNIPAKTLYRWRSYFKQASTTAHKATPLFTQVVTTSTPEACIKLKMGDIQLQFTRWPDPQWLAELLTTRESP